MRGGVPGGVVVSLCESPSLASVDASPWAAIKGIPGPDAVTASQQWCALFLDTVWQQH